MENNNGRRLTADGGRCRTKHSSRYMMGGYFFIATLLMLFSCTAPEGKSKQDVMNERLERKLISWRATYGKKCGKDVLEAAAAIVDSTLIANARNSRRKNRPPKPRKPGQPIVEIPVDTTPIAPLIDLLLLFGDTAFVDSLLLMDFDSLMLDSLLQDSILRSEYEFYFPDTLKNDK